MAVFSAAVAKCYGSVVKFELMQEYVFWQIAFLVVMGLLCFRVAAFSNPRAT